MNDYNDIQTDTALARDASVNLALDARDICKTYRSGAEELNILRGASLQAQSGETIAITGASGCGKTTLLNILGSLDKCDSGTIMLNGKEPPFGKEKELALFRGKNIGFVFQFHYLLKDFTALENVMLSAYINGTKKKDALEKARALLEEVNMGARLSHYPDQLSGGERQRCAVARSLINEPDIILADEPTGNLDSAHAEMIATLLFSTAERHHKTLIVVTHDEKVAGGAQRRLVLQDGVLA
jgi:lipoprotein-releasing system ATP-binding protein